MQRPVISGPHSLHHLGKMSRLSWFVASQPTKQGFVAHHIQDPWIRKIGFPVLTVAEEPGQIGVKQSRFLSSGDVKDEDDETLWWIPLGLEPSAASSDNTITQLTTKEETLRNVDEAFYKLNRNQVGFYRTNYPPARLAKLGAERSKLSVEDRIGLIADAAAMAIAGYGTTAGLLALLENFGDEESYA